MWRLISSGDEQESTPAMKYGVDHEMDAVSSVECLTGKLYGKTGSDQESRFLDLDWITIRATPDGVLWDDGLEVKCPRALHDEIPMKYQIQLCGQFMVWGFGRILYAEWAPAETRMWHVYPNPEMEDALNAPLKEFVGYVESKTKPPKYSSKAHPKPVFPTLRSERVA
jgi:hypothetical protein